MKIKHLLFAVLFTIVNLSTQAQTRYVKQGGAGAGDGLSWANASGDFQAMINQVNTSGGGEVWVAKGEYTPASGNSFEMKPNVKIYGGFPDTGNPGMTNRDWEHNITILRGNDTSVIVNNNNGLTNDNSLLDGFSIRSGSSQKGGGMYNFTTNPSISNCTFVANHASVQGGAMYNWKSSLSITNCKFSSNTSIRQGAGIFNSGSNLKITNCTFKSNGNTSVFNYGGAMYIERSSVTIKNCEFYGNYAEYYGAAIYETSSNLTIKESTISGNGTNQWGGGLYCVGGNLTIENSTISDNRTGAREGGGIGGKHCVINITNSTISGNKAGTLGGGMYTYGGTVNITNSTISGNKAGTLGGGMCVHYTSIILEDCIIKNNNANNSSGGIYNYRNTGKITNCTLSNNTATTENGGGIYNNEIKGSEIDNCTFLQNEAKLDGGGMYNSESSPNIDNCTFLQNTSEQSGGGIFNHTNSNAQITNCKFFKNIAETGGGGGIGNHSSNPIITNNILSGNKAQTLGGGIHNMNGSKPDIINCVLSGNHAETGGGIYNNESEPNIINATISGNKATHGGGIYNAGSCSPKITNNIIVGNSSGIENDGTATPAITYSLVQNLTNTANGNINSTGVNASDIFVDWKDPNVTAWEPTTEGDYRIKESSTITINKGDNSANSTEKDLDGNDRTVQTIDLGAYESNISSLSPTNNIIYVKLGGAGDKDGSSWANATSHIVNALKYAKNNAAPNNQLEIWTAEGEYQSKADSSFEMTANTKIYGGFPAIGNPALEDRNPKINKTILKGNNASVLNNNNNGLTNDNFLLDGFIIKNGNALDGGAMNNTNSSPLFVNCSFSSNNATNGGVMYNTNSQPKFINCKFSGNIANYGGIMYNKSNSKPTFINCTLSGNKASIRAGIMYNHTGSFPEFVNCIISGNNSFSNNTTADIKHSLVQIGDENSKANMYDASGSTTLVNNSIPNDIFVSPEAPGLSDNGDYSLKTGSPAINKGDNTLYDNNTNVPTDLANNPRTYDITIDLAAYEYNLKKQQSITADNITKEYGDADFSPATASSGLSVTYTVDDSNVANAAGNNIHIVGIGTTSVTVSQAGDGNYDPAPEVSFTLTVTQKALTASLIGTVSKVYDGNTIATLQASNYKLTGIIGLDDVQLNNPTQGIYDDKNVGTNKTITVVGLSLKGSDAGNYKLASLSINGTNNIITKKELSAILIGTISKEYDGNANSTLTPNNCSLSGIISGDEVSINNVTGTYDNENVGNNKAVSFAGISLSGNDADNYKLASTNLNGTNGTISPKAITVTADAKSKTYKAIDPTLTYTVSPKLINGDFCTGSLIRDAGEDVGEYDILQGSLSAGSNYTISFTSAKFQITAKIINVTAVASSKVYNASDPEFTYTVNPVLSGGDNFTGSLSRDPGKDVGEYNILKGSLSAGNNYTINFTSAKFNITPKAITVTAEAKTKVYGANDPVLTYVVSPALIGSDSFTGSLSRDVGEDVGEYGILQGSLSAGNNYTISFTGAKFIITPKSVTVTAEAKTKIFGETDPEFTYTVSPRLIGNDSFTGSLNRETGENIGEYNILQGGLTGGDNYTFSFVSAKLTITPKTINVTAEAKSKTYKSTDPELTYKFNPQLIGSESFTGSLLRDAGEDVGEYNISQGSLSIGDNYTINFTAAKFNITPKVINVIAEAKTKVYGELDPVITYTVSPELSGGDNFAGSLSRDVGENVGEYNVLKGSLSAGNNYKINFTSAKFNITPKDINVAAELKTKIYGESDPVLTYTASPALTGSDIFTGTLSREEGEDVGEYGILQGSLSAGNNYTISFTGAKFIITPKSVTVTAEAKTKIYGETDPELTYTVSPNMIGNDSFTGSLTREAGENIGEYNILIGGLAANKNYQITFIGAKFIIQKIVFTGITFEDKTFTYDGNIHKLEISGDLPDGVNVNYSNNEQIDAGVYKVTAYIKGSAVFEDYSLNAYLTIEKAPQTISWEQQLSIGCNGTNTLILNAVSSSGLKVNYVPSNTSVVSITNNKLTVLTQGNAIISAIQEGNNNYLPALPVGRKLIYGLNNLVSRKWNDVLVFDNTDGQYKQWQWFKNDEPISGSTNQYYDGKGVPLKGIYYAKVTDNQGNIFNTCPIEIQEDLSLKDLSVWPNPASKGEELSVKINCSSDEISGAQLYLVSLEGSVKKQIQLTQTDVKIQSPNMSGVYVIKIVLPNGEQKSANFIVK